MKYKKHKQYRLPGYDYSADGKYFVTICIDRCKHYFGEIENGLMILSETGAIVDKIWNELPKKFDNVRLDVYQIMPDHFHGIVVSKPEKNLIYLPVWKARQIPTFKSGIINNPMELKTITLGRIIRWFKGRVKFEVSKINPDFKWQARYHDRIIRDEKEFYFISQYILNNPQNWGNDVLKQYLENLDDFNE